MIGVGEVLSALTALRDLSYDTVFHMGDTALQFSADVIRGPDNTRYGKYAYRQIERRQRKAASREKNPSIKEKPLKYEEKRLFTELMKRQSGETIIEHWKRQKLLLAYPAKQQLVKEFQNVTSRIETAQKAQDKAKLEEQFKALSRASYKSSQRQGHKS